MDGEKNKSQITCFMYDQWMVKKTSIQKKKKKSSMTKWNNNFDFFDYKGGFTDRKSI